MCENEILTVCDGLAVCEMNEEAARDIAEWRYPEEYSMYDFGGYEKEEEQLFNGLHFSVYQDDELVGFVSVGPAAQVICRGSKKLYEDETFTDIGVGLRPSLCGLGRGLGLRLVNAAVAFVKTEFPDDGVRLTVAKNNERAVKVYKKAGFRQIAEFKEKRGKFCLFVK